MITRPKILPADGQSKKGGTYGVAPTGKAADAQPTNRTRGDLKPALSNTQTVPGRAPQRASRVLRQHPELHGFGDPKTYQRVYWNKRGQENIAAGLRFDGTPRRRQTDLPGIHGTKRHVIRNQQRAERFMAEGLTWRGTPRKRHQRLNLLPAWREFRESIND